MVKKLQSTSFLLMAHADYLRQKAVTMATQSTSHITHAHIENNYIHKGYLYAGSIHCYSRSQSQFAFMTGRGSMHLLPHLGITSKPHQTKITYETWTLWTSNNEIPRSFVRNPYLKNEWSLHLFDFVPPPPPPPQKKKSNMRMKAVYSLGICILLWCYISQ